VVISPIEGTPAAKAGIISQDVILKIDGKSTKGMDINKAVQLIRGQEDTNVTLTIQRGSQVIDYKLARKQIEIHPVEAKFRKNEGGIGYVRLKQFSANAADEMRTELQKLETQGASGYIIDLRSNPGGLLYGAIDIARMFLNEGKIVSTKSRVGTSDVQSANRTAIVPNKPIVVIVDGGSASASEILSGALQDNKRAQLVGMKTFGKGLVQSVRPLSGEAGMAVTIARYYTPNGKDINKLGIKPDIEVKMSKTQMQSLMKDRNKIATSADPQYAKALQLLRGKIAAQGNPSAQKK
jgi:carboxyl-terminal processing protease